MAGSRRLLACVAALVVPAAAGANGLYLHEIPTQTVGSGQVAADASLRVRVFAADPDAASLVAQAGPGAAYRQLPPSDPERFRSASFLIDFDEPAVAALSARLVAGRDTPPTLEELRRFAGEAIPHKSFERGWDMASRVAATGVGDCTEHAVLLTALARATGRPARVALGLLVVHAGGEAHALGHAWTEVQQDGRWIPVDATPVADQAAVLAYLPLALLSDEGPGYLIGLARQFQDGWARRVEVGVQ